MKATKYVYLHVVKVRLTDDEARLEGKRWRDVFLSPFEGEAVVTLGCLRREYPTRIYKRGKRRELRAPIPRTFSELARRVAQKTLGANLLAIAGLTP